MAPPPQLFEPLQQKPTLARHPMPRALAGGLLGVLLCATVQATLWFGSPEGAIVSTLALVWPFIWTLFAVPLFYVPILRAIERRRPAKSSRLLGAGLLALLVASTLIGLRFAHLASHGVPASWEMLYYILISIEAQMFLPGSVAGAIGASLALRPAASVAG